MKRQNWMTWIALAALTLPFMAWVAVAGAAIAKAHRDVPDAVVALTLSFSTPQTWQSRMRDTCRALSSHFTGRTK